MWLENQEYQDAVTGDSVAPMQQLIEKSDLTGTTRPSAAAVAVENVFLNRPRLIFENWRPKNDK